MRLVLYLLGVGAMLAAGLGMALLPRLIPNLWLFGLAGGVLTGIIFFNWLLLGATAGAWPRLRTGQVLIVTGLIGAAISLWDGDWKAVAWSGLMIAAGLGLTFPLFRVRRKQKRVNPGPVRPPLNRREQI